MISVIIVDYKTAERCVKYINDFCRTSDYKDVSFVVVDNTPNEENGNVISENLLESGFARSENYNLNDMKFKHIRTFNRNGITVVYVSDKENRGFAFANNLGAEVAKNIFAPEYLLFSNSDIQLPEEFELSILKKELEDRKDVAMIGPKVVGLNGKDQSPGKYMSIYKRHIVPNLLWPMYKAIPKLKQINYDVVNNAQDGEVYRIIGAFMLAREKPFFEVGGFDEHTFLYAEEPILTERFREKGYKIWYTNEVKIIHEQGVSTTDRTKTGIENLLVKRKRVFDSEMYYYEKYRNCSRLDILLAKWMFQFYILKLRTLSFIIKVK